MTRLLLGVEKWIPIPWFDLRLVPDFLVRHFFGICDPGQLAMFRTMAARLPAKSVKGLCMLIAAWVPTEAVELRRIHGASDRIISGRIFGVAKMSWLILCGKLSFHSKRDLLRMNSPNHRSILFSLGRLVKIGLLGAVLLAQGAMSADQSLLPMIAVVPLEGRKVDSLDARTISDALTDHLLRTKAVRVMERSQIEVILREQGFQQSGACDGEECAVQIGKLLGIDRIVVGSVASFGKAYSISVREVDVRTGEVLVTASKTMKGEFENLLTETVPQIANDLVNTDRTRSDEAISSQEKIATIPLEQQPSDSAAAPTKLHEGGSSKIGWWIAGGLAVAGGATAVLLLSTEDSKAEPVNTDVTVRWAK